MFFCLENFLKYGKYWGPGTSYWTRKYKFLEEMCIRDSYEAVTKPNIACGLCNPRDVQRENYDAFAGEIEGVFAFVEGGKLFIKLPLLPAKVNHGVRGKLQGNTENYYYFFNRSLDESLNKIEAQIPHFEQQNIAYFSVFSVSSKAIPDAENIDTKSVTDIICLHTICLLYTSESGDEEDELF